MLFGFFTVPVSIILKITLARIMMIMSYAGIFNMVSIFTQNKTTSAIINLFGVMSIIFVVITLIARIQEPKLINALEIVNGQQVWKNIENTRYLSNTTRAMSQFTLQLLYL